LKFLVNDWGAEKFRDVLETEYLGRKLDDLEAPPMPETPVDHVGVFRQTDGNYYVGVAATVGRISGTLLNQVADIVEAHGSRRVRTTPMQKLVVLDVAEDKVESLITALDAIGLHARPSQWRRNTMACTGIEYCKLAIVNTKDTARHLVDELEQRVPELDTAITVNVNGCPNSCARIQTADIGLKGMLVNDADGNTVEGFQVHLGGALGLEAGFGRKLRAHKVSADQLPDYVEKLSRTYLEQRDDDESFARWVSRADEEVLR
jgi:sulfite reductase (ferredoxin)